MVKIDLHIHTIASISDKSFEFDLEKLREYTEKLEIDCIAITNHNLFDLKQYQCICKSLNIKVLPGIEIDLEGGHLLLIADNSDINDILDFSNKCNLVNKSIKSCDDYLTIDQFKQIFPSLDRFLLIPHYHKKPILQKETIQELNTLITAGEVSSLKKFKSCIKDKECLVPVIFSDSRYYSELDSFSTKQTYIDLNADNITFAGIKLCLTDKQKVFLSKGEGNDFFQATDDGLKLSTGLNVILGGRSTGKTYTLNKIAATFENVKYIKQFSLLQDDEEKFSDLLSRRHSSVSEEYLNEFKKIVDDIKQIDREQNELDLENYINSLLKFASESEKEDAFSNTALFSESLLQISKMDNLKKIIDAVSLLEENTEYKEIIERHIKAESFKSLKINLMKEYLNTQENNLKKKWINELISNIKNELKFRTSSTIPEDIDFYNILMDKKKIEKFDHIVNNLKSEKIIESKEIRGFKLVATSKAISSASQLQKICKRKVTLSTAFRHYSNPYEYLSELKKVDIEETELYKYFVLIEYETLNKHGFKVSGGERSEFNLLHEINDALKHDMLLIDEPESSFDNVFLKNEVNALLRDISKSIPVIVVTHNSTVGASIKPHYIVCTKREIAEREIVYKVYSGFPSDKQLTSVNGEFINNFEVMLDCLEAGNDEYNKRRMETYEILKN